MKTQLLIGSIVATLMSCDAQLGRLGGDDETFTDAKGKAVVYGTDNRTDVYAHPDETLRARAMQSTVALMSASTLSLRASGAVSLSAASLGDAEGLCAGERFANDPAAAFCSGTLIDDDLVLTAGHCITSAADCASARFVFNYYRSSASALQPLSRDDVFSCAAIVARAEQHTALGTVDFAVLRLDRKATPRFTPAPVRATEALLVTGQRVAVIGSGSGVPFKIDSGGAVRDPGDGADFVATTDTFGGNSGSGVYELDGYSVAGILVEGDVDYVRRGSCQVVNVCRESACSGETVVMASNAVRAVCRVTSSARLCGAVAPPAPMPPALAYTASATNSATVRTVDQRVTLRRGQRLDVGTCGVVGAKGTGDTFIRITDAAGVTVGGNDDACGRLSFASFTAPSEGVYVIKGGCYAAESCGGTLAYVIK